VTRFETDKGTKPAKSVHTCIDSDAPPSGDTGARAQRRRATSAIGKRATCISRCATDWDAP